jgi:IS5 family transposase
MVGLLYLKHAYNESDESVCERWAQDPDFPFPFCGECVSQWNVRVDVYRRR